MKKHALFQNVVRNSISVPTKMNLSKKSFGNDEQKIKFEHNKRDRLIQLNEVNQSLLPDSTFVGWIEEFKYFGKDSETSRDEISKELYMSGFLLLDFSESKERTVFLAQKSSEGPPAHRVQTLDVIIATYNEVTTIEKVVNSILELTIEGLLIKIIIIEGNSSDGTRDKIKQYVDHPRVLVILEDEPRGKGFAVRLGLAKSRSDLVLIQDADLEYDINDYEALLKPLMTGVVSFVLGARERTLNAKLGVRHFEDAVLLSRIANIANHFFRSLFNTTYRTSLRDPFTMYKVFRSDCIYSLNFESEKFDFDWEILAKLVRIGYHPLEIPVSYESRSFKEGKKIKLISDPLTWLIACFKFKLKKINNL